jgi:hypothetical protein
MSPAEVELPNVAELLARVLQRVPAERRPLLIAIAERMAAARYRDWASQVADPARRSELLACADREEEIARRVEAMSPEAAAIQRDILAKNADLEEINRSLFAGRPLAQQFAIQAQGERLGAATWRSFARQAEAGRARDTFLSCAALEEQSAAFLESFLREGV